MTEQKIEEENIENNFVLCIDRRKTFATKSKQKKNHIFRNPSHKNKIRLFYISVFFFFFFNFGLFTCILPCASEQFRKKVDLDCNS